MIRILINRFVALLFICFICVTSIAFFPVALVIRLVTIPFDKRLKLLHQFTCLWASLYLWAFPLWSVRIHNQGRIDKNKTYVFVANHQSLVDILVAFRLFTHFKWVSNSDLFKIPLLGWNMVLNRYIRFRRGGEGSRNNIKKMYRACEKHLKRGSSIFVFPEGDGSATDTPGVFREGAFVLAKRANVPILPIVISGSAKTMADNRLFFLRPAKITVTILEEIKPESFQELSSKVLAIKVREIIASELTIAT